MISRESHIDIDIEELESPHNAGDLVTNTPRAYIQREEHESIDDIFYLVDPLKSMRPSKRPKEESPTKRRPS